MLMLRGWWACHVTERLTALRCLLQASCPSPAAKAAKTAATAAAAARSDLGRSCHQVDQQVEHEQEQVAAAVAQPASEDEAAEQLSAADAAAALLAIAAPSVPGSTALEMPASQLQQSQQRNRQQRQSLRQLLQPHVDQSVVAQSAVGARAARQHQPAALVATPAIGDTTAPAAVAPEPAATAEMPNAAAGWSSCTWWQCPLVTS